MAAPAVDTTVRVLSLYGPGILRTHYFERYQAKPGLLGRLQAAAGPHKSGADPHIAGRALDIILRRERPWELRIANNLIDKVFLPLRETMRWGGMVYNEWEWNSAGVRTPRSNICTPKPTDDDAATRKKQETFASCMHYSHIHIEWGGDNLDYTGFESQLATAVQAIADASEYKLVGTWDVTIGDWTGQFVFDDELRAKWTDAKSGPDKPFHGKWYAAGGGLEWKFNNDLRTFHYPLPVATSGRGDILPAGQGWFDMTKA